MVLAGAAAGIALGIGFGAVYRVSALPGEGRRPGDAGAAVALTILAAALLAALPAVFRAVRIDPVAMLRAE